MILRPYQITAVDTLWKQLCVSNRVLCVAPCGSGKTELFQELTRRALAAKPDVKILVIVNKVSLVEQTARRMNAWVPTSVYCGSLGEKNITAVTVASVQSAFKADLGLVNWVIIDEAHRLNPNEDSQYSLLFKKLEHPKLKVLGFTATPFRATGLIYGADRFFPRVDYKISLEELWEQNFLVEPTCEHGRNSFNTTNLAVKMGEFDQAGISKLVANESKVIAQIKDAMPRLDGRKKVAWACANIAHAESVRAQIGEDASIIHSKMSLSERESQQYRFEKLNTRHIVFVNVLSEGYDYPPVDAIILMCPTRSPVKYVQTVGRGLRVFTGKKDCLVLDYGAVIENCGPITDPRIPKAKETARVKDTRMKFCPNCLTYCPTITDQCPECDHIFYVRKMEPKLTKTAFSGSITGYTPKVEILNVQRITFSRFVSSNNNICFRIDYHTLLEKLSEFSVWGHEYSMLKLSRRLSELNCTIKSTIEETVAQSGGARVPNQIEVVREKFTKIKRVIFTARDTRFSQQAVGMPSF